MLRKIGIFFTLIRFKQYIKNIFVFAPLFFSLEIATFVNIKDVFLAFISFCFSASFIYILNDLLDAPSDREHPTKKLRPIASGLVNKQTAIIIMSIFLILSFFIASLINISCVVILSSYIFLNICYCLKLKHVVILDAFCIAAGFILRLLIGSQASSISLSHWIIIMTFLLALFLAFAKRRDDVLIFETTGKRMRKVIEGYNLEFLNSIMSIMCSVTLVAYIQYVTSFEIVEKWGTQNLYLTTIFVLLGILRYLKITIIDKKSGSPTKIVLNDLFIQLILASWVLSFLFIILF